MFSLIASGQKTPLIKPPFRYIEGADTFTVFRLQDERVLAYKVQQLNDCQDEVEIAKVTITAADSLIKAKEKTNSILTQEKGNLIEQGSIKDKIITTYVQEVSLYKKQVRILKIEKGILAGVAGALAILSTYLIIK